MRALRALGASAATAGIYLGLSLAGWGLGDVPGFFNSPERTAYAVGVAVFALAIGVQAVVAPEGIQGSSGREDKVVRRQGIIGALAIAILFGALFLLPLMDRRSIAVLDQAPASQWLGVALATWGYLLVFLSGWFLGKQYSAQVTIQQDHHLVTTGPYRYIRHPRYLGLVLLTFGLSLIFRSWTGLGLTPLVLAWLLFRIRDEESLLQSEFKEQWTIYCARTKRLIPFVY